MCFSGSVFDDNMNSSGSHRAVNDNTTVARYLDPLFKTFPSLELSDM
jgi:hypothetical protein